MKKSPQFKYEKYFKSHKEFIPSKIRTLFQLKRKIIELFQVE